MTVSTEHPNGHIVLGGDLFFLAKDKNGNYTYREQPVPTQEGDPMVPRRWRWNDWSRGMGDSRGVLRGTVEYAENAFLGHLGRILPGPKITTIETNCDSDVMAICEVTVPATKIIVGGGTKVVEFDPTDDSVDLTTTITSADVQDLQPWLGDQVLVACGDSVDYYVRSAAGAYAANSISKKARAFGRGPRRAAGNRLVRGYNNTWSSCTATNVTSVNNWSTEYVIGDSVHDVQRVFEHNRWDYVLKDDGLFTFDEDTSEESNALSDLEHFASTENRWVFKWYDHVFVCTVAGLYRFIQQGAARTVGIEELAWNESELRNVWPTAGVAFGKYMWVAFTDGTSTWIVQFRRALDGDSSMGAPYTPICVIEKFTGKCRAMFVSDKSGVPRVYYGAAGDIHHFKVSRDGLPVDYRDSGTVTVRFAPTDMGSPMTLKQARSIESITRNLAAARAVSWTAGFDRGTANAVGAAITAAGYTERFWTRGTNDAGRLVQLIASMTVNSTTTPPEIDDVILNYEERPEVVPGFIVGLRLRDNDGEGDVHSNLAARELRDLLRGYMDGALIEITDMFGDTYAARIGTYQGEVPWQFNAADPQMDIAITVRKLAYS